MKPSATGVVIGLRENGDWVSLASVFGHDAAKQEKVRYSLCTLGSKLRRKLGLRADPFIFRSDGRSGLEIQTVGIAGAVTLAGVVVEIFPKFIFGGADWNESLTILLRQANWKDVAFFPSSRVGTSRQGYVDLLAMAYVDALKFALATQPIHMYRTKAESLPVLRGRINIHRHLNAIFSRPHLVECDVDRLDSDNHLNSLLKWAAIALMSSVRAGGIKRVLADLVPNLAGSLDRRSAAAGALMRIPPQYEPWRQALEIAALLFSGSSHSAVVGRKTGYSFSFNMERLFERFVEKCLQRAVDSLSGRYTSHRQVSTLYARPIVNGAKQFYSRPDNIIKRDGYPIVVVDAKYKKLADAYGMRDRKPVNADVYELVAAMTAQDCPCGLLVYPRIVGDSVLTDGMLKVWSVNAFGRLLHLGAIALEIGSLMSQDDVKKADALLASAISDLVGRSGEVV